MQTNEALKDNYYVLNEKVKKMQDQIVELEKRDNDVYRAIFEANPIPDSARAKNWPKSRKFNWFREWTRKIWLYLLPIR